MRLQRRGCGSSSYRRGDRGGSPLRVPWRWWLVLLVLLVAVDLLGGAPANALLRPSPFAGSAPPAGAYPLGRLVRHPLGFSALHLHPRPLAALLPEGT